MHTHTRIKIVVVTARVHPAIIRISSITLSPSKRSSHVSAASCVPLPITIRNDNYYNKINIAFLLINLIGEVTERDRLEACEKTIF